jgi:potassium-transporting ATPase potassium-binding subunit
MNTARILGKQIQAREVKLASVGTLFVPLPVIVFAALAVAIPAARQSMSHHGPQGFAVGICNRGHQTLLIRWQHRA